MCSDPLEVVDDVSGIRVLKLWYRDVDEGNLLSLQHPHTLLQLAHLVLGWQVHHDLSQRTVQGSQRMTKEVG